MRLPVPVKELFDCCLFDLAAHLPAPDDPVWSQHDARQRQFAIQADTRSIVFTWLMNWRPGGPREIMSYSYAPKALAASAGACAAALEQFYGGQIVRLMLAELRAGGTILEHSDVAPALRAVHRCHVPIVTNDGVDFRVGGLRHRLREGVAYEIDNTRPHEVTNRGATPRVHLICDVMPLTDSLDEAAMSSADGD